MQAIVLAGGFGTRLRQLVPDLPKPMAPVAGRPFLEILLDMLARAGFRHVVLAVGYRASIIQQHFVTSYAGMTLAYATEDTPLGTGGAIRQALYACRHDPVFVFNGDTYLDLETPQLRALWQQCQEPILVARQVSDTSRYGRVDLDGQGYFCGFSEKGRNGPGLINAGCYVMPRTLLDRFPVGQAFSLETDFLAHVPVAPRLRVFVTQGKFIDIGVPEDYARAQILLKT